MKLSALWLLLATGMLCASQTLTIDQQQALKIYNHKPSQAKTVLERMKKFATVSKIKAMEIAEPVCQGSQESIKLIHQKEYLFYRVKGDNCEINVNALDGDIISSEALDA